MCWLDGNGRKTNADTTTAVTTNGMMASLAQKQYMKKVRDRYRGNVEDLEAGLDRYNVPPKKRFWQSMETFDSYESQEDVYEYDLRSPKGRFGGDNSMRAQSDDWL